MAIARHTVGNFRLVQRLRSQIERILDLNALRVVTKEALVMGVSSSRTAQRSGQ